MFCCCLRVGCSKVLAESMLTQISAVSSPNCQGHMQFYLAPKIDE